MAYTNIKRESKGLQPHPSQKQLIFLTLATAAHLRDSFLLNLDREFKEFYL
ncbi:hypothetical protein AGMMS50233_02590 [Endomicrobiia bacterium]|nr:hypothetical protein AGMMS50233_02590 [Endomicrobiia bacterium]